MTIVMFLRCYRLIINLDSYELEMGFIPKWVDLDEAILVNNKILKKSNYPRWTKRETQVLEYIKKFLVK